MIQIREPDWLKQYPDGSYIREKEMLRAFGLDEETNINFLLDHKAIPEPVNKEHKGVDGRKKVHRVSLKWLVNDLREVFDK